MTGPPKHELPFAQQLPGNASPGDAQVPVAALHNVPAGPTVPPYMAHKSDSPAASDVQNPNGDTAQQSVVSAFAVAVGTGVSTGVGVGGGGSISAISAATWASSAARAAD